MARPRLHQRRLPSRAQSHALPALLLATGLLLAAAPTQAAPATQATPVTFDTSSFAPMDRLMVDLQLRASQRLGQSQDFQITAAGADYPLGTLLRAGTTIPIDYEACKPTTLPPAARVANLFPRYDLSRKDAIEFGLNGELSNRIATLEAKSGDTDTVEVTVEGTKMQTLSDTDVRRALARPACAELLRGTETWLVRGHIRGTRRFLLKNVDTSTVNGGLARLFSFKVEAGPGTRSVEVKDAEETAFLQIISALVRGPGDELVLAAPGAARAETRPAPPPPPPPKVSAMTPEELDRFLATLNPASGGPERPVLQVVKGERQPEAAVAARVPAEATLQKFRIGAVLPRDVPERLLPATAELRYFHAADAEAAQALLESLRPHEPAARLVRVRLPAPRQQFELWMPQQLHGSARP